MVTIVEMTLEGTGFSPSGTESAVKSVKSRRLVNTPTTR